MTEELPKKLNEEEMFESLALFRANRQQMTKLKNKILAVRLEQLRALKQHYQDYRLDLELKSYETTLDSLVSKTKFSTHQNSSKRLDELELSLTEKNRELDKRLGLLEGQLSKYKALDPNLLAEYRKLKDDLECQELLIRMGEDNKPR